MRKPSFSLFPRHLLKGWYWSIFGVYPSLAPTWEHKKSPEMLLWQYVCSHMCRTEQALLSMSSKHQTKASKVAKRGPKPCNFDEIHLHDPVLSFSSAQGDFVDDTHSARMWVHIALCLGAKSFFGLFFSSPSAPFERFHWSNRSIVLKSRAGYGPLVSASAPATALFVCVCDRRRKALRCVCVLFLIKHMATV